MSQRNFFPPNADRTFTKCLLGWFASIFVVGIVVYLLELTFMDTLVYNLLQIVVPGYGKWVSATNYNHEASAVWFYMTITLPVCCIYMLKKIREVNVRKPMVTIAFSLFMLWLPFELYFFGNFAGFDIVSGEGGYAGSNYADSLIWMIFYSALHGAVLLMVLTIFILTLLEVSGAHKLLGDKND